MLSASKKWSMKQNNSDSWLSSVVKDSTKGRTKENKVPEDGQPPFGNTNSTAEGNREKTYPCFKKKNPQKT